MQCLYNRQPRCQEPCYILHLVLYKREAIKNIILTTEKYCSLRTKILFESTHNPQVGGMQICKEVMSMS